jgi:hypothetical protein
MLRRPEGVARISVEFTISFGDAVASIVAIGGIGFEESSPHLPRLLIAPVMRTIGLCRGSRVATGRWR